MTSRAANFWQGAVRLGLLGYIVAVPLPFGSVLRRAQLPVVALPLLLLLLYSLLQVVRARQEQKGGRVSRAYLVFTIAGGGFLLVIAAQLIPLSRELLEVISPNSLRIWSTAEEIHRLLEPASTFPEAVPVSVTPLATRAQFFRVAALLAVFQLAHWSFETRSHRLQFAAAIGIAAFFQVLYGLADWPNQIHTIWGWKNRLILERMTGTYVNPNHFAHLLALAIPFGIYFMLSAWNHARGERFHDRLIRFLDAPLVMGTTGALLVVACVAGILLAASRGALLALVSGGSLAALIALSLTEPQGHRRARLVQQIAFGTLGFLGLVVLSVMHFGVARTIGRFVPLPEERVTLVGRALGAETALEIWRRYPILGSGLGSFETLASSLQPPHEKLFNHAHNDYLEIAATTGFVGFVIGIGGLIGALMSWLAMLREGRRNAGSSDRRLFSLCGMTSLLIAMIHAMVDFNFFIPANAAILAAIVGAAVAISPNDKNRLRPTAKES